MGESPGIDRNPIRRLAPDQFRQGLRRLQQLFAVYATTSPAPLPCTGLVITSEIRRQSELYLPIDLIRRQFYRYYRASLCHPPLCASTPFHEAQSWADCFSRLPRWCQCSANPAHLLQRLLNDAELHERFIYASFLPSRYNGPGFGRYPVQHSWLERWFVERHRQGATAVHCLDAACGSGEGGWELAELARAAGWQPQQVQIAGWTLDPLEVYAAANRYLPHLPRRQAACRQRTASLVAQGWEASVGFCAVDLCSNAIPDGCFDLIVCNGLLGGPMLHEAAALQRVIDGLAGRLRPRGVLLAADHFHGGWHRQVGDEQLPDLFRKSGLLVEQIGEGTAGRKVGDS